MESTCRTPRLSRVIMHTKRIAIANIAVKRCCRAVAFCLRRDDSTDQSEYTEAKRRLHGDHYGEEVPPSRRPIFTKQVTRVPPGIVIVKLLHAIFNLQQRSGELQRWVGRSAEQRILNPRVYGRVLAMS